MSFAFKSDLTQFLKHFFEAISDYEPAITESYVERKNLRAFWPYVMTTGSLDAEGQTPWQKLSMRRQGREALSQGKAGHEESEVSWRGDPRMLEKPKGKSPGTLR